MRSILVAYVALGVATAAFASPAYSQFGPFIPDGHRGPVFVPQRGRHVENFRRHDERREREEWRRREAFRERNRYCGREWGCRRW